MKVKFVSKLNKMSETVFLVLSKKSALKNIGFNDKHLKEITKSMIALIQSTLFYDQFFLLKRVFESYQLEVPINN